MSVAGLLKCLEHAGEIEIATAEGTAVGFAGSSSSETSDTLICRKKPREFNAHRDGKRFIVKPMIC